MVVFSDISGIRKEEIELRTLNTDVNTFNYFEVQTSYNIVAFACFFRVVFHLFIS